MMSALTFFGAEASGPSVHVAPAPVYEIAGITITNSMLYGWICMLAIIVLLTWVAHRVTVKPQGGLVQFVEAGVDFISGLVVKTFDDKSKGYKYVPFFVTLFFFILLNNWFGLLPVVGEGFRSGESPLLRPFTADLADLNGTLAAGIVTMAYVYISSVREAGGFGKYIRHFFIGSPWNPLYLVIGLLEILTDLTRLFSLSLRLFLNVTIGEIVIGVFAYLGSVITPALAPFTAVPFLLIELFVGALQAYIFTILSLMYLAIATNHAGEHGEEHENAHGQELTDEPGTGTMKLKAGEA
jgi:F-type H+-transporting ATPase subunit a